MSDTAWDELVVLQALRDATLHRGGGYASAWEIQRRTVEYMGRNGRGARKGPMGDVRVRRALQRLRDEGLAHRLRSWGTGHIFKLTDAGRAAVPAPRM